MKRFKIELVKRGVKASVYTIRYEGEENELRKFFQGHAAEYRRELQVLSELITKIAEKRGATDHFVKTKEGKLSDAVVAIPKLPHEECSLRLYCWRISPQTLIIFNGGIKDQRTYQEVPDLDVIVKNLQKIGKLIDEKSRYPDPEIVLNGNDLEGIDGYFDLEEE